MNGYESICPLDVRYGANANLAEKVRPYLSEEASLRFLIEVEVALVALLEKKGLCPAGTVEEVRQAAESVTPDEVQREEVRVSHPIVALVNCMRRRIQEKSRRYVHFMATSADIVCSADACRYKRFTASVLLPRLITLERTLINLARKEKNTLQIGRTHGQHAEPITFGFQIAQYVSRLGGRILRVAETADDLRGKFAGAVGAYNSMSLFLADPEEFEREMLAQLGLLPSPISTQIVQAEFLVDYVHSLVSTFGVIANIADDMRQLQRTEIGEVEEFFGEAHVGSSTMPQKRNPLVFETIKSLWKVAMPMMVTTYSDQLSEHQRDWTNRESQRYVREAAASLYLATDMLDESLKTLGVRGDRMEENFARSSGMVAAEPAHLLLSSQGFTDGHEAVRRLAFTARNEGADLRAVMFSTPEFRPYLEGLSEHQRQMLKDPRNYTGIAGRKAEGICDRWGIEMERLEASLAAKQTKGNR